MNWGIFVGIRHYFGISMRKEHNNRSARQSNHSKIGVEFQNMQNLFQNMQEITLVGFSAFWFEKVFLSLHPTQNIYIYITLGESPINNIL